MGVQLKQLADSSAGLEGSGLDAGAFIFVSIPYNFSGALVFSGAVLQRACVVQSIIANPDAAATNPVTATAFKAASGVALGAGVALHSGTVNLQGVAGTNLPQALSAVPGALLVPAGSRIGVVVSGALGVAGNGVVTIALTPA